MFFEGEERGSSVLVLYHIIYKKGEEKKREEKRREEKKRGNRTDVKMPPTP